MTEYETFLGFGDLKDKGQKPEWHMCSLAKADAARKIKDLAREPKFICIECWRVSSQKRRLCKPETI